MSLLTTLIRRCVYAGFALLLSMGSAQAVIFVYELPGGERMITDQELHDKNYRLIRKSHSIKGLGAWINHKNQQGALADIHAYDDLIRGAAEQYRVDAALIKAVMHAESAFNPHAISRKGASGLMQLMPDTAKRYGVDDIFDPRQNVHGGVAYLRDLLKRFDNNLRLVLAAYNAGENAVARHKGIPPYPETQGYVKKVLRFQGRYGTLAQKQERKPLTKVSTSNY